MTNCKKLLAIIVALVMLVSTLVSGLVVSAANPLGTLTVTGTTVDEGKDATVTFNLDLGENSVDALHMLVTIASDVAITDAEIGEVAYVSTEKFPAEDNELLDGTDPRLEISTKELAQGKLLFESGVATVAQVTDVEFTVTFATADYSAGDYGFNVTVDATDYDEADYDVITLESAITVAHVHSYDEGVVTDPTCVADGYTTYTCTCGYSYTKAGEAATGHNFVEGVCDVCGAEDPDYEPEIEKFEFYASNITLGNALNMNFAVKKADVVGTDNYAVIVKTFADGRENNVKTVPQADWGTTTSGGVALYTFSSDGLPAKEMGDEIHVTIYNSKDQAISEKTDSVMLYVSRNITKCITADKSTASGLKNYKTGVMLADMIVYGKESQIQTKYNTTDLVTDKLTAELGSDSWLEHTTKSVEYKDTSVKGNNYVAANLSLKESIELNIAVKNITNVASARVSYTKWNGTLMSYEIAKEDFNYISPYDAVKINTLVVGDCFADVTIELLDAEGKVLDTSVDSVSSYCARQKTGDLYPAVMKFVASSYAYLTRNK